MNTNDTMNATAIPDVFTLDLSDDDDYFVNIGENAAITLADNSIVWNEQWYPTNDLSVKGNTTIDGDLIVKGVNVSETLSKIEEHLAILRPNTELEKKWDKLRELREEYMKLEKELLDKEKVWDILNR